MEEIRIDRATAHRMVDEGARLVDVRTPEEYGSGALPGAVNLPVQVIAARIGEVAQPEDTIVLYCKSGARSDMAARILRSMGYKRAWNMGGIGDW